MKKLSLAVAAFLFYLYWAQSQHDGVNLAKEFASFHGESVILYSTQWDKHSAKARQFLTKNRISYYEYDVEESSKGLSQFKQLGGKGVPLLIVNNRVIKGYSSQMIRQALAAEPPK